MTARSIRIGLPQALSLREISARTSFGRQLPPKPHPASRNEVSGAAPARRRATASGTWEACSPRMTSTTSTSPTAAQRSANSFENEIIVASSALDAYLIISAVRVPVHEPGHVGGSPRTAPRAAAQVRASMPPSTRRSGSHEVADGLAFGQELRVHADAEVAARRLPPTLPRAAATHDVVASCPGRPCS